MEQEYNWNHKTASHYWYLLNSDLEIFNSKYLSYFGCNPKFTAVIVPNLKNISPPMENIERKRYMAARTRIEDCLNEQYSNREDLTIVIAFEFIDNYNKLNWKYLEISEFNKSIVSKLLKDKLSFELPAL